MSFDDFMAEVHFTWMDEKEWRYGQTLFNVLYRTRPDLTEQIRATPLDPFYAEGINGDVVKSAIVWIEANW